MFVLFSEFKIVSFVSVQHSHDTHTQNTDKSTGQLKVTFKNFSTVSHRIRFGILISINVQLLMQTCICFEHFWGPERCMFRFIAFTLHIHCAPFCLNPYIIYCVLKGLHETQTRMHKHAPMCRYFGVCFCSRFAIFLCDFRLRMRRITSQEMTMEDDNKRLHGFMNYGTDNSNQLGKWNACYKYQRFKIAHRLQIQFNLICVRLWQNIFNVIIFLFMRKISTTIAEKAKEFLRKRFIAEIIARKYKTSTYNMYGLLMIEPALTFE